MKWHRADLFEGEALSAVKNERGFEAPKSELMRIQEFSAKLQPRNERTFTHVHA